MAKRTIVLLSGTRDVRAGLLFEQLSEGGAEPLWVQLPEPLEGDLPGISYLGNGECRAVAAATLGEGLTEWYWELSRVSQRMLLDTRRVGQVEVVWKTGSDRQTRLLEASFGTRGDGIEDGVLFDTRRLTHLAAEEGAANGGECLVAAQVELELLAPFGAKIHVLGSEPQIIESEMLVISSEWLVPQLIPWLRDKWLVTTLSAFRMGIGGESAHRIFGLGSDHFWTGAGESVVWSYRSLFEDSAIGIHHHLPQRAADGWNRLLEKEMPGFHPRLEPRPVIAALSCDGLPVVGPLPFSTTTFVAGAYSGRGDCFALGLVRALGESLLGDRKRISAELSPASLRRF